ncbi:MAG: PaaI family thioesterase [Cyclobacteriaceae bacterium]
MENKALAFFKANIGQPSNNSPSPIGRWLNGKLIKAEEGNLAWEYEIRPEMTNPGAILHGGIASTMLDDVMGATVFSLNNEFMFTSINLNVDFLASAKTGDIVTCEAQVVRKGSNVIHMEAWLKKGDKVLAKAASNLIKTRMPVPV